MKDLITALNIFFKYSDDYAPTHCEHDELMVNIDPSVVSDEDKEKLDTLGFFPNEYDGFSSYRFGSC